MIFFSMNFPCTPWRSCHHLSVFWHLFRKFHNIIAQEIPLDFRLPEHLSNLMLSMCPQCPERGFELRMIIFFSFSLAVLPQTVAVVFRSSTQTCHNLCSFVASEIPLFCKFQNTWDSIISSASLLRTRFCDAHDNLFNVSLAMPLEVAAVISASSSISLTPTCRKSIVTKACQAMYAHYPSNAAIVRPLLNHLNFTLQEERRTFSRR